MSKSSCRFKSSSERTLLSNFQTDFLLRKPTLLYGRSLHGKSESAFFNKMEWARWMCCDHQEHMWLCYTSIGWAGYYTYKRGHWKTNMAMEISVYCAPNQGPRFGNAHDINAVVFRLFWVTQTPIHLAMELMYLSGKVAVRLMTWKFGSYKLLYVIARLNKYKFEQRTWNS